MKTNIIGIIVALVLAFAGAAGALAQDERVNEVRKVDDFSSIRIKAVANVEFTQGDKYSLRLEGKEKWVKLTTTEVKDGCLIIDFKRGEKRSVKNINGLKLYVTAPTLEEVELTGVGSLECKEPLKLDDFTLRISGVGSAEVDDLTCRRFNVSLSGVGDAEVNVDCDYLKARMGGVGNLELRGSAGEADVSRSGIGSLNTKRLKIKNEE
ncbi:DUF2807 domain-containing protein [Mediterranea massiliensis]|uniref:DUF2807 domain-containing protein n=1 Tax=Mediterranea massiliensis TaxID=1841865 RepID=A0ABS2E0A3_9BACT|nr:head GIN domain-containing protein [Mediterranea massiliensis]MBM6735003.1 DUF2807 domain-containing protein [Mediterranea massiliensis]